MRFSRARCAACALDKSPSRRQHEVTNGQEAGWSFIGRISLRRQIAQENQEDYECQHEDCQESQRPPQMALPLVVFAPGGPTMKTAPSTRGLKFRGLGLQSIKAQTALPAPEGPAPQQALHHIHRVCVPRNADIGAATFGTVHLSTAAGECEPMVARAYRRFEGYRLPAGIQVEDE